MNFISEWNREKRMMSSKMNERKKKIVEFMREEAYKPSYNFV